MRKLIYTVLIVLISTLNSFGQELAPYLKIGELNTTIDKASDQVIETLTSNSFSILGTYSPSKKNTLKVIVFTNNNLKNTVINVLDRGALAGALKIGLIQKNGKTTISYTNPEYLFRAYLGDDYNKYKTVLNNFTNNLKTTLTTLGTEFTPFGGFIKTTKLKNYHYKIMMPYFSDPITLNEFNSFDEGLKIIEANLKANKAQTKEVYRLVYLNKETAVFGIALENNEEGEAAFLPIIGESNIAAMPYEIILQGKKVTMLHGKYRLALSWPELSMGTFMKIMSTPGNIEDALESVCK